MIIEKDIAGDIIDYFLPQGDFGQRYKSFILLVLTILLYPVLVAKNLYALRHVSYLGTLSVLLLLMVIVVKSLKLNIAEPQFRVEKSHWGPESFAHALFSLPIILIAFLCQFNVLGVYSTLFQPSPDRINSVLRASIGGSGFIYILFGISGYFFAYDSTRDNILNNFSSHDPSLIIARCGLLVTIICQIPMVVVPCRDSIVTLITKYITRNEIQERDSTRAIEVPEARVAIAIPMPREDTRLRNIEPAAALPYLPEAVTIALAGSCLWLSECVPGVASIWSVAGSSVSLILAFYLPAKAFVSRAYTINPSVDWRSDPYLAFSVVMVYVSTLLVIFCSSLSIQVQIRKMNN